MNSLFQQLNPNMSQPQNPIIQMFKMAQNSNNPQQMLMNMAQNNPQTKQVLDFVKNSGKSPKDLFYAMAKQKGIDPNSILNQLK